MFAPHVRQRWRDGTRIDGWVEAQTIEPFPLDYVDTLDGYAEGACGYGVCAGYHGPAVLHGGAAIYESPDGVAWARAPKATRVMIIAGDAWVTVTEIPGLVERAGCRLTHAHVKLADVTYLR